MAILAIAGCNEIAAERQDAVSPDQCQAWGRTYMDALRSTQTAPVDDREFFEENLRNATRLAPKIEECQKLGYVPTSVPIVR